MVSVEEFESAFMETFQKFPKHITRTLARYTLGALESRLIETQENNSTNTFEIDLKEALTDLHLNGNYRKACRAFAKTLNSRGSISIQPKASNDVTGGDHGSREKESSPVGRRS